MEQKSVKTREDKKEALKEKRYTLETVVKGSLQKYIKKTNSSNFDFIDGNIIKNKVIECIESRTKIYSKRVVKGSILINYFLRYILQKQDDQKKDITEFDIPEYLFDQTFIRQLFLGNKECRVKFNDFEVFLQDEKLNDQKLFNDKEYKSRHLGDRNIYSFGAKKYLVNCENHLILNFDSFLNKYLYNIVFEKYKNEHFFKDLVFMTRSKVHNWSNIKICKKIEDSNKLLNLIALEAHKIRNILKCQENEILDKKWMKKNLSSIICLYAYILNKCEDKNNEIKLNNETKKKNGLKKFTPCIKLFNLLPLHTIKPHFISIDNSVFEGIYKEVFDHLEKIYGLERTKNILPIMDEKWKISNESINSFWSHIFNFKRLEGQNHIFSFHIGTDGRAIDFHFKRHINLKGTFTQELEDKLKKIREKYEMQKETEIEKEKKDKQDRNKKEETQGKNSKNNQKSKTQEEEEREVILDFLKGKRVLGLDPGRVTIMYLAEELEDGTIRTYKLTRCHYYRKTGIIKSRKLTECWIRKNYSYRMGLSLLSKNSIKTYKKDKFLNALNIYNSYWDVFWGERMKMRWRSNIFNLYNKKKSVFQQFFNNVEKDNEDKKQTVIAYGSARFSPTAKNEMAIPSSRSYKECKSRYATFLVNEFRSTVVKYNDLQRLYHIRENIIDKENGEKKLEFKGDLRGLLWFSNQKTNKFIDRDLNGAMNIRNFLFYGSLKPAIFTREVKFEKEKLEDKKIINKIENKETIKKMIEKVRRSKKKKGRCHSPYKIVKKKFQTQAVGKAG